jgi:hypothetical protein
VWLGEERRGRGREGRVHVDGGCSPARLDPRPPERPDARAAGEASHLARRAEQRGALVEHLLQVEALQADARSRARPGTAAGAILAITRVLQLLGRPVAKVVRQVAQYLARRGPGVP